MSIPERPLSTCRPVNRPVDLPLTPPSSVKQTSPVSPPPDQLLAVGWRKHVEVWVQGGADQALTLHQVSSEDQLDAIFLILDTLGVKPRYDWSTNSETVVLTMPHLFHELPGTWLCHMSRLVDDHIRRVAVCGRPRVSCGSAYSIRFDNGIKCADQSILLSYDWDGPVDRPPNPKMPRIVLETAYTQTQENVIKKAWSYLHESQNAIHAVIVCTFKKPYPNSMCVEIAVWTREATGIHEQDFVSDPCWGGPHQAPSTEDDNWGDESDESEGSVSQDPPRPLCVKPELKSAGRHKFKLGPLTAMNDRYFVMQTTRDEPARTIRRRNASPLIVYDEQMNTVQNPEQLAQHLVLDVYDILRPCEVEPYIFIDDRAIYLPLISLRDELESQVRNNRQLDKQQQNPSTDLPTNQPSSSRPASLPPRYPDDVKQPARKRRRNA